ncbi:hypothetical protein LTR42_007192 [Elasticomyces elasticus]|nr:hypothetical protein LTR42_007192 [Elasticomyces elasticus]
MESLLSLPPELRLLIFEAIIATPRLTIKEAARLTPKGRPQLHPLARTCWQLHDEFSQMYQKFGLEQVKYIESRIYDFDFSTIFHLLDLKQLDMIVAPTKLFEPPAPSADRMITVEIIVTQPEMPTRSRTSLNTWYEHCKKATGSRRMYRVRFKDQGSVTAADLRAIGPALGHGLSYERIYLVTAVRNTVLPSCSSFATHAEIVERAEEARLKRGGKECSARQVVLFAGSYLDWPDGDLHVSLDDVDKTSAESIIGSVSALHGFIV